MGDSIHQSNWEWEIKPESDRFSLNLRELLGYKDLLISFFRRELLSGYNQTIVGVFWIVLQPILTALFYFIVFKGIVKVSTDGIPAVLFYLSGSIIWSFFSDCMSGTMYSFLSNAHIYQKVYFPRLIVPLSIALNHLVRFVVQLVLFAVIYCVYDVFSMHITPTVSLLIIPLLVMQLVLFAMGIGLVLSVYVTRYRDIEQLMFFVLRLYMFITPIVYPASIVPERYRLLFWMNPLTPVTETFRSVFFHSGPIQWQYLFFSFGVTVILFLFGLVIFKRREIKVMDTV